VKQSLLGFSSLSTLKKSWISKWHFNHLSSIS
jgi:hypothetical protein